MSEAMHIGCTWKETHSKYVLKTYMNLMIGIIQARVQKASYIVRKLLT